MAQQYQDMYQDYSHPPNRSPGSTRGYGNGLTLNRQPSRHFDSYGAGQAPGLYTAQDHLARYDEGPRFDRMGSATLHSNNNYQYESQTWNNYGGANGSATLMGGTGRVKPSTRRAGIPTPWLAEPQMQQPPSMNGYQQMNGGQYNPQLIQQGQGRSPPPQGEGEELIPTAIVIKNIPFAVKKEQLVALMTDLSLPLPYAFNYHFDAGVFRGLAFANFTTADETRQVIEAMNHMDLQGRKLRVEYKKMLPAQERERIERDKREKRGQLQEQHQPLPPGTAQNPLHAQSSMTSLGSIHHPTSSPSPVSMRGKIDIDLNDPTTLSYYNELVIFKSQDKEHFIFPSTIPPHDRRIIHTLAHHMGLDHRSTGEGEGRVVQVFKRQQASISPPVPPVPATYYNEARRGLNRAATIDFSETRDNSGYHSHTLGRQRSDLLEIPSSPGLSGLNAAHNLRAAKSFADLRSYTPSPVPSTASFPVGLSQNVSRYTDYGHSSAASGTPNLTPTSAGGGGGLNNREDPFLLSGGLNNLSLFDGRTAARTNTNGRIGQERENHSSSAGPIGSQRPVNGNNYEETSRNGTSAVTERQPRGPGSDWGAGSGFSRPRQNGHVNRGSGELDLNSYEQSWDDNRAQDSSDRNGSLPSNPPRYL